MVGGAAIGQGPLAGRTYPWKGEDCDVHGFTGNYGGYATFQLKSPHLWMAGCLLAAFVAKAQFVTQSYTREFTFGTADPRIVQFVQVVFDRSSERSTKKEVICGVPTSSKEDAIVRVNSTIIAFPEGAEVGTNAPVHPKNPGVNIVGINVLDFVWELRQPGNFYVQTMVAGPFKARNDVVIGFRLGEDSLARFGWMRLYRKTMEGPPGSIEAATF